MSCATFESVSHRFNEDNLIRVQVHPVGSVEFLAAFHQNVRNLLGSRIGFGDDVIDIRQYRMACAVSRQFAVIDCAINK